MEEKCLEIGQLEASLSGINLGFNHGAWGACLRANSDTRGAQAGQGRGH